MKLLRNGFGLQIIKNKQIILIMLYNSLLELKKFCITIYRLTKNKSMKEYCLLVGWDDEIDYFMEADMMSETSKKPYFHSVGGASTVSFTSEFNRVPFLSLETNEINSKKSYCGRSISPSTCTDASEEKSQNGKRSRSRSRSPAGSSSPNDDTSGGPKLRRESSFIDTLDVLFGESSQSTWRVSDDDFEHEEILSKKFSLLFSEKCLLSHVGSTISTNSNVSTSFCRHIFQVYEEGRLIFKEVKGHIADSTKTETKVRNCTKLMCSTADPKKVKNAFKSSQLLVDVEDTNINDFIIAIELHEDKTNLDNSHPANEAITIYV